LIARIAVLAEVFLTAYTVYTGIASAADVLVCTVGTFFKASFTDCCTLAASVSAVTDFFYAVTAVAAFITPAVCITAFFTDVAVTAEIVVTVVAVLSAFLTDNGAIRAAVTVVADCIYTVSAVAAVVAPAVIPYAVLTPAAVTAEVIITVVTVFSAFLTDQCTFRAPVTVVADKIGTILAGLAVQAKASLAAGTVDTPVTAFADIVLCTVSAFFHTILTDFCTIIAAGTAVTYISTFAAVVTFITPAVVTAALLTYSTVAAEVIITVFAVLVAGLTDHCTLRAAIPVVADILHTISADTAVVAPAVISYTALAITAVSAQISGTVCTLFRTSLTDIGTL